MSKKRPDELRAAIYMSAANTPAGIYVHNKSGDMYTLVCVALREEDLEPMVIYSSVDDPEIIWTRPMAEFKSKFTAMETQEHA